MKLAPATRWIVAKAAIIPPKSAIVRPDETRNITRCYLIEEVGPLAAEAGYRVGDLVVARAVHDMFLQGGEYRRVMFIAEEVILKIFDVSVKDLIGLDGRPLLAQDPVP